MDGNEILNKIDERWLETERYELIRDLKNAPDAAATGGEAMANTGTFLAKLEVNNPDAYNEVKDLILQYFDWCLKYRMHIRLSNGENYGM
jgi:hypothetical protein